MPGINRQRVRTSFHRGAADYDQHTPVQQRVVEQVLSQLHGYQPELCGSVLDIGCGTGRLLERLMTRHPEVSLTGLDIAPNMLQQAGERLGSSVRLIQGDAEQLPFTDEYFTTVLSSSTFQWLDSLQTCFREIRRVLLRDGWFVFSLFGEGTLCELGECWGQAWQNCGRIEAVAGNGTHRFHTGNDVMQALETVGFRDIQLTTGCEVVWYQDVPHLLHAVKRIGAGTARPPSGGGLGWRRLLHEMAAIYVDRYGTAEGIPASYGVIYAAGRR